MKNVFLCIALFIALTAAFPGASPAELGPKVMPGKVAGVEFDYPAGLPTDVERLAGIKAGDAFSPLKVRDAIKVLYIKGMFDDIAVDGRDTDNGVVLIFRLVPRIRVSKVVVDGNDELSKKKIKEAMTLKEDDYIDVRALQKSKDAVLKLYKDEGYPKAEVIITPRKVDELSSELVVAITEGAPSVVREVRLSGVLVLPEKKLYGRLKFGLGDILRKEDLDASVKALSDYYTAKDYVGAKVDEPKIAYAGDGAVSVDIRVDAGPKLDVGFEGNESMSDSALKKALTFYEDRDVSPESVSENIGRLTDLYKKAGWYFAVVTSRTEESASPRMVSVMYVVYEGPRVKLGRIEFAGNKETSTDDLKAAMELQESSFFRSRRITDEAAKEDAERIKSLYESRGFLKTEVGEPEIDFEGNGKVAVLKININEGPLTVVRGVEVKGNKGLTTDEIKEKVGGGLGKAYSPDELRVKQDALLNLYSGKGYMHVSIDVGKKFSEDGRDVVLVYDIKEGMPASIGRIIFKGNDNTRDKVINRELQVKSGEPYDLEKILMSQQKIYKLGFFSQVRIQPIEPDKPDTKKDLLVSMKERPAGAVEFGAGYGDFDKFRGSAEVTYRNVFGYGHRVSARGEISTKEYKGVLSYKWPWFMDLPMDFKTSLVFLNAEKVNYNINDRIFSAGLDKTYGDHITTSLVYQYENLKLGSVNPGTVLAPEDRKKSSLASVSPSIVFDYRDNPFNPTTGSAHALILKWASRFMGSTVDFLKFNAQTSWYFPLYKGVVFGFSARGGVEGWFSKELEVPISERFFLGGASSLRGYKVDKVAPRGVDGTPAGGDTMVLFNAETRVPLPYGFGLVGFLDAGNVWLMNKHVSAARVQQLGTNGLRYGTGFGLRYDTPVGPLRLDYGFKLDRLPDESAGELHFTLGNAF